MYTHIRCFRWHLHTTNTYATHAYTRVHSQRFFDLHAVAMWTNRNTANAAYDMTNWTYWLSGTRPIIITILDAQRDCARYRIDNRRFGCKRVSTEPVERMRTHTYNIHYVYTNARTWWNRMGFQLQWVTIHDYSTWMIPSLHRHTHTQTHPFIGRSSLSNTRESWRVFVIQVNFYNPAGPTLYAYIYIQYTRNAK